VLYVVLLSPVLLLSLALAVDLGGLQLQRQRLGSAVDQAAVVAAAGAARASAAAELDAGVAASRFRQALVDNLQPLSAEIAGSTPEAIARAADVVLVTSVPAPDPLVAGSTLRRPTIEARVRVPIRAGLLHLAGIPDTVTLTLTTAADLRVIGGAAR
jgi:Flp pilus assembly protein TadG